MQQVIDDRAERYKNVALQLWDFAELGYQEERSTELLQTQLKEAGFEVTAGVAGMPTSFIATYGSGQPVIGILAEFDALPGLSQTTAPFRQIREEGGSGHACGHHLFGTASIA
ncbi:MAG: amidohydrolase, partial [Acidobacteria bacterium]|nr:amidohydrolase [Acidobacteriota bacterium]